MTRFATFLVQTTGGIALAVSWPAGGTAALAAGQVTVPAGRLDAGLRRLATATGWQILFDPALIGDRRVAAMRGGNDPVRALARMLGGTGLRARRLGRNLFIIVAASPPARPVPLPSPARAEDDIVVTALKRPTTREDTEISIATLSASAIDARALSDLRGAARLLPGLVAFNTSALQQRLAVRGVSATGEATVGVYYGETPIAGPSGTGADPGASAPDIDLVDVERIELLKGPQGTLYGGSSMGGTLRILPHAVDLDRAGGHAELRGDGVAHGHVGGAVTAVVNPVLRPGRLALRLVAYRRVLGGYIDNNRLGTTDAGSLRRQGVRVQAAWRPSDALRLDTLYLHQETRLGDGSFWDPALGRYRVAQPTQTVNTDRLDLASATLHVTVADMVVTATASHLRRGIVREIDYSGVLARQRDSAAACRRLADLPATATCDAAQQAAYRAYVDARLPAILYQPTRLTSTSGEVRIAAPPGARVAWTVGAFVETRQDGVDSYAVRAAADSGLLVRPLDIIGLRTIATGFDQQAVFAEATHPVVPRLSATAGLRLYHYRRAGAGTVPIPNLITGSGMPPGNRYTGSEHGRNMKGELAYRVPDGPLVYALVSEGFRPGGINVTPGLAADERLFGADHLWNYELGVKAARPRWSVEAAAYRIDWRDATFAATSANGAFVYNVNLANVAIRGAELRASVIAGPIRLAAAGSFTDARLGQDTPLGTTEGFGRRGDRLPNLPRWAWLISGDTRLGPWTLGTDVGGNSASPTGFNAANPYYTFTPPRTEVAARADWRSGHWWAGVNIDNMFDAVAPVRLLSSAFGERQLYTARPRTISLRTGLDW
jgi:outer membrane receptor protein involved in Fe transport